jgi:hypothetical protein
MKRLSLYAVFALALILAAVPCARADHVFVAFLDGDQETPPTGSAATGMLVGVLSEDGSVLNFAIQYSGLQGGNTVGTHYHKGDFGVAGPIVRPYDFTEFDSPDGYVIETWKSDDQQPLTDDLITALFDGGIYFNIHTQTWPGGEIRGQMYWFFSY